MVQGGWAMPFIAQVMLNSPGLDNQGITDLTFCMSTKH